MFAQPVTLEAEQETCLSQGNGDRFSQQSSFSVSKGKGEEGREKKKENQIYIIIKNRLGCHRQIRLRTYWLKTEYSPKILVPYT